MVKKKAKGTDTPSDPADRKRHEQPLQAVLLAEDWQPQSTWLYGSGAEDQPLIAVAASLQKVTFHPLVLDRPKILCPLLNQPMIDYTIHYLCNQGVQELYVLCVTQDVEDYILQVALEERFVSMKFVVVRDTTITNDGDALREMDKRNVIQSEPFILLYGSCITNLDLSDSIQQHKSRRAADSSAIVTMLLKQVGSTNTTHYSKLRASFDDLVIGLEASASNTNFTTKRVLLYDNNFQNRSVKFPCSFMNSHCTEVQIYTDLYDIGIDLCSPDMLARFSDEFDYRHIRNEFVANSVAEEEEGLQNKIYAYVTSTSSYAARVHDFRTYHTVARDVLRRYVYPTVPDNMAIRSSQKEKEKTYRYSMQNQYMYLESATSSVRIGRTSTVRGPGLIGSHCTIGEHSTIRASVLCNQCSVSDHCTIVDSHIWDNVSIESNVSIRQSIVASHVVIKSGAVIPRGCIIGAGCVIGRNVRLDEFTRLTCRKDMLDEDFNDDVWNVDSNDGPIETSDNNEFVIEADEVHALEESKSGDGIVSDAHIVGVDGKGRLWEPLRPDDDDDELEGPEKNAFMKLVKEVLMTQCIGYDMKDFYMSRMKSQQEDDDTLSEDDDNDRSMLDDSEYDNADNILLLNDNGDRTINTIVGRQDGVDVVKELKTICLEYEGGNIENLAIELNSYKFSQNASYADCTMAAMMAIIDKMNISASTSDGKLVSEFKSLLEQWKPLLHKMSLGIDEEKAIVNGIERSATEDASNGGTKAPKILERCAKLSSGMSFRLLLQTLHDQDVVGEDAILSWAADRKQDAEQGGSDAQLQRRLNLFQLPPVREFLEWLDEDDDDDEDED
jgi:translation initiation factor eIF-2B subunit epsilon